MTDWVMRSEATVQRVDLQGDVIQSMLTFPRGTGATPSFQPYFLRVHNSTATFGTTIASMREPLRASDPERLGPYELTNRLDEDGQGVVFLGRAEAVAGPVAVKLLRPGIRLPSSFDAAEDVEAFCLAAVIDGGMAGEQVYLVRDYVDGPTLADVVVEFGQLRGKPLDRVAIGTLAALIALHQKGISHGDFRPEKVVLGPQGPRVVDFGLPQPYGSAAYMAPEQFTGGSANVLPAADVFSWAATLAYAASEHAPFGAAGERARPDLESVPGYLRESLNACLQRDPDERPSASQLLLRFLGRPADEEVTAELLSEAARIADGAGEVPAISPWPSPEDETADIAEEDDSDEDFSVRQKTAGDVPVSTPDAPVPGEPSSESHGPTSPELPSIEASEPGTAPTPPDSPGTAPTPPAAPPQLAPAPFVPRPHQPSASPYLPMSPQGAPPPVHPPATTSPQGAPPPVHPPATTSPQGAPPPVFQPGNASPPNGPPFGPPPADSVLPPESGRPLPQIHWPSESEIELEEEKPRGRRRLALVAATILVVLVAIGVFVVRNLQGQPTANPVTSTSARTKPSPSSPTPTSPPPLTRPANEPTTHIGPPPSTPASPAKTSRPGLGAKLPDAPSARLLTALAGDVTLTGYEVSRSLYIWNPVDQKFEKSTYAAKPRVSPDGRWLAAVTAEGNHFVIVDRSNGDVRAIRHSDLEHKPANVEFTVSDPQWSHNGRYIIMPVKEKSGSAWEPNGVVVVDTQDTDPRYLPIPKPERLAWNAAGTTILANVADGDSIKEFDLGGKEIGGIPQTGYLVSDGFGAFPSSKKHMVTYCPDKAGLPFACVYQVDTDSPDPIKKVPLGSSPISLDSIVLGWYDENHLIADMSTPDSGNAIAVIDLAGKITSVLLQKGDGITPLFSNTPA